MAFQAVSVRYRDLIYRDNLYARVIAALLRALSLPVPASSSKTGSRHPRRGSVLQTLLEPLGRMVLFTFFVGSSSCTKAELALTDYAIL
jgi:hypothetical protein